MSRRAFEHMHLLILKSAELGDVEVDELCKVCDRHGIPYAIKGATDRISKQDFGSNGFTQIVSNTVLFDFYNDSQDALIPVTTTQYVYDCAEKQKGLHTRPYSPDPKHVLKDVHICIGNLPESDKQAIYGGVRALGGAYSETLSAFITHVISTDPNEDCVVAVQSVRGFNIKAVHPQWIDLCLKLRKKVDDAPYELNSKTVNEQQEKINELDVIEGAAELVKAQSKFLNGKSFYLGQDLDLTERSQELITSLIQNSGGVVVKSLDEAKFYIGQFRDGEEYITASRNKLYVGNMNWIYWMVEHQKWVTPYRKLLHHPYVRGGMPEMREFVISATNYTGDARFYIKNLVLALGANFTTSLKHSNTHLISGTPTGKKYEAALKWDMKIVNHLWLEECYSNWKLQPYNHPRYAASLSDKVDLTSIVGETTLDIEVLKKFYEDGFTEGVTNIVEDSEDDGPIFPDVSEKRRSMVLQDISQPSGLSHNASSAAADVPSGSSSALLSQIDIREDQAPIRDEEKQETSHLRPSVPPSHEESDKENDEHSNSQDLPDPGNKSVDAFTPRKLSSTNIIPSSVKTPAAKLTPDIPQRLPSGRKAKDMAAQRLHEDMEKLNYFQQQQRSRSKDAPLLPEEIEAKKRKREELLKKETRKSSSAEPEAPIKESPKSKKAKRATPVPSSPYHIIAVATGCDLSFSRPDTQILQSLGIMVHKELVEGTNAIVAPKLMRTEKFLTGLSYEIQHIISPDFLLAVLKTHKADPSSTQPLPKLTDYSIDKVDPKSVTALTPLGLNKLMEKCRERISNSDRVFKGIVFNITPKIPGGASTAQKILRAHGCKDVRVVKTIKEMKSMKSLKASTDGCVWFLTMENGFQERFKELTKESGTKTKIVGWEWVVASIFKMDFDVENVLFSS
ncbi:CYFA0S03e02894g1_1 [Cyberlindnera fabianii]|uniref:BRCT-containing protein 1 n=1 Tax=Cyberlindnera fabianii TaxID=36022 RepID=A0A061AVK6_CYBFA|nr:BRCT-containing protein 1 [Cyberlindnera fabianii]CDR39401.1 CYFA0S03e02894g1_1 [Cyberlindnera fabianii]